jgi:hypothetical protein
MIRHGQDGTLYYPKNGQPGEKWYHVGYRNALEYEGALATRGETRYYAVLYPDDFVDTFGRNIGTHNTPGSRAGNHALQNEFPRQGDRVFTVRTEQGRNQVHVGLGGNWDNMTVDGVNTSQADWMRRHAVGVVEFDSTGRIIAVRRFQ